MLTPALPEGLPLKLHHPSDVLAAVPFVLGFEPANSLVAISLRGRRQRVGLVMRADYPSTEVLDMFQQAATDMVAHLTRDEARAVLLIAYPPSEIPVGSGRPGDRALEILEIAALDAGIVVREVLLVMAGRWWSLHCRDETCCPSAGTALIPLIDSRIAAEVVVRGGPMPFANEAGLAASIAHHDSLVTQCLAQSIEARAQELLSSDSTHDAVQIRSDQRKQLDRLFDLWCASNSHPQILLSEPSLLADVVIALQGVLVRDYALGIHTRTTLESALGLWRWLLTLAPEGTVAPVACLAAATAYESGNGALAQRALDRALTDSPDYSLAHLLRRVFLAGFPPETFAQMRAELHDEISAELKPS